MQVYQQENRSLRVDASLKDAEQISNIVVHSDGKQVVRVSDRRVDEVGSPLQQQLDVVGEVEVREHPEHHVAVVLWVLHRGCGVE